MPINKSRTVAVASGVGFTYNNFNQNLAIATGETSRRIATLMRNNVQQKQIFATIHRCSIGTWRTSTYASHKFYAWRIKTELFALRQLYFDGSGVAK
jgi:hypothetical protein